MTSNSMFDSLIAMKVQGITPEYVDQIASSVSNPTPTH